MLAVASCGALLEPKPDPTQFYVLTPLAGSDAQAARRGPALGIGPIQIPDYLDRPQMVTRVAPNRVTIAEFDRWAEPLGSSLARILSQNLATLANTDGVQRFPWPVATVVDYQIEVEFVRFEATVAGKAELAARWSIKNGTTKKPIVVRESQVARAVEAVDTPAVVAALSDCLAQLSREIAAAIPAPAATRRKRGRG